MFDNTQDQLSKFRTKNCFELNDDSRGTYNTNSQIKFETSTLGSSLCDYSDTYILVKVTITVTDTGTAGNSNNRNRKIIFKNCAPFTDCMSEINYIEIDAKNIDAVMPIYNLIF